MKSFKEKIFGISRNKEKEMSIFSTIDTLDCNGMTNKDNLLVPVKYEWLPSSIVCLCLSHIIKSELYFIF